MPNFITSTFSGSSVTAPAWRTPIAPRPTKLGLIQRVKNTFLCGVDGASSKMRTTPRPSSARDYGISRAGSTIGQRSEATSAPVANASIEKFFAENTCSLDDVRRSADVWRADANGAPDPNGEKLVFGFLFARREPLYTTFNSQAKKKIHEERRVATESARDTARRVFEVFISRLAMLETAAGRKNIGTLNHRFASAKKLATVRAENQDRYIFSDPHGVALLDGDHEILLTRPGTPSGPCLTDPYTRNNRIPVFRSCTASWRSIRNIEDMRISVNIELGRDHIDLNAAETKLLNWYCLELPVSGITAETLKNIKPALQMSSGKEDASLRKFFADRFWYGAIRCLRERPLPGLDETALAAAQAFDSESYQRGKECADSLAVMQAPVSKPNHLSRGPAI